MSNVKQRQTLGDDIKKPIPGTEKTGHYSICIHTYQSITDIFVKVKKKTGCIDFTQCYIRPDILGQSAHFCLGQSVLKTAQKPTTDFPFLDG